MPFFRRIRRKSEPGPLPTHPHQQQHWVAYMYAPQPVHMPPMYSVQTAAPYQPTPKYFGHSYRIMPPVQYIYHQRPSTTYSNTPQQHAPNVRSAVESDYHHRRPQRPSSRGAEADHYPFPYSDNEYDVQIQTHPKQSVFSTLVNFARGRSKSRGRVEPDPTSRPRSRGSFVDNGHDRERGRAGHRERRLSSDKEMKKAMYESQKKITVEKLEQTLRSEPLQREDPYRVTASTRRSSITKTDLKRQYEVEDRSRAQHEQYERSQVPNMRPPSRGHVTSPDGLSESPMLMEHTKLNGRPVLSRRSNTNSGYHTDAPPSSKASRRSSVPLHIQMQRLDLASPMEKPAPLKVPEGFFNQRGDQLMNSKGDILRRPPHLEYPPEFTGYPSPGTGWQDHKGQLVGPDLRWIRKVG